MHDERKISPKSTENGGNGKNCRRKKVFEARTGKHQPSFEKMQKDFE